MTKICDATLRYEVAEPPSAECIDCGALWASDENTRSGVVAHIERTSHTVTIDTNHRELWGMA